MSGSPVLARVPSGQVEVTEVADHVFAYIQGEGGWCVSNAGVLTGPHGATVVDTAATIARARRLAAAVDRLAAGPARLLVNTHFHGDHTFGNAVFGDAGAVIVAHEQARREMAAAGLGMTSLWPSVDWGEVEVRLPQVTFRDRMTLHLRDREAELIFVGPAHTITDAVVWLPAERVLFAGDVVMPGCTPFVLMGSVHGSLRAISALRAMNPLVVVGGHGPVAGPEVLDDTERYLRWLLGVANAGAAAGLTPLAAAQAVDLGEYVAWLDPERLVGNLHRAYAEVRGEPEGAGLDVVAIFGEMVSYNRGRLPACYA